MERSGSIFLREFEAFALYLKDHTSRPRFWSVVDGGAYRDVSGPVVMWTVAGLISNTTLSPKEVWNLSVGEASWYDASIAEREGSQLRFLWDDDLVDDDLSSVGELTEDEIYKQAISDLGQEGADKWYQARKENQKCH